MLPTRRRRPNRPRAGLAVAFGLLTACSRPAPAPSSPSPLPPPPAATSTDADAAAVSDSTRAASLRRLERIGVIGANVSAGYGDTTPLHVELREVIVPPHAVFDASSSAMFVRPDEIAQVQLGVMRLRSVRMVVAVDFLFWFAAGIKPSAQRDHDLERGLAMLDTLDVPLFVGDLPDVHGADPRMISPRQIPSVEDLRRLNARIDAWIASRPQAHKLPLAAWTRTFERGEPVEILGVVVQTGPQLMQDDRLHPSPLGQALLAALVMERVVAALGGLGPADLAAPDPAGSDPSA